jgi:hypothetical protein
MPMLNSLFKGMELESYRARDYAKQLFSGREFCVWTCFYICRLFCPGCPKFRRYVALGTNIRSVFEGDPKNGPKIKKMTISINNYADGHLFYSSYTYVYRNS